MNSARRAVWSLCLLLLLAVQANAGDTFLGDGTVVTDVGEIQDHLYAVAGSGDAFFLGGMDSVPGPGQWRVEKRRTSDGALVPAFGVAGVLTIDLTTDWDRVTAVVVDGDDLFLIGEAAASLHIEKRSASSGQLRRGFGTDGVLSIPTEQVVWWSSNSAVVVRGHLYVAIPGGTILKLRTRDGARVEPFEPSGNAGSSTVTALAATSSALFLGVATQGGFRIEKRGLVAGELVWAVDEPFEYVGCGPEDPLALAVAGRDVVVGGMKEGRWHVERRAARDGMLGWAVDLPSTGACDRVMDVVLDGGTVSAVGAYGHGGRVEQRRSSDGALVRSFGEAGVVALTGPVDELASVIGTCGDLIVGGNSGPKDSWITKRLDGNDGAPVTSAQGSCKKPQRRPLAIVR